jgi:hypothetical protein
VSAQLHAAAILDRLRTSGSPALVVHDGKVADGAMPPYVVMHFSGRYEGAAADPASSDLAFRSRKFVATLTLHCVATTAQGARGIAQRVSTALLDYTPTVTGRTAGAVKHIDDYTPAPDEQTGTDYFDLIDVYRLTTWPG